MIIEIITKNPEHKGDNDFMKIDFDGRQQFYVFDGEPEDNTLTCNFSGCFMIKGMLEKVIAAAHNKEPITILYKEV